MKTLEYNSSSREVEALQKRLAAYALPVRKTGTLDDQTMAAINTLSARIGLSTSFKDADSRFLKALAEWEKQKFTQIIINGKKLVLTEPEMDKLRKDYGPKAEAEMMPFVRIAEQAKIYWDAYKSVKDDNWFWGNVVEITTRAKFPSASTMDGAIRAAEELRAKARADPDALRA